MSQARENFFNLHDPTLRIAPEHPPGPTTPVFSVDSATRSITLS